MVLDTDAKRMLIADDNRDWADSLAMLMANEGFTVRTSYDGREAVEAAQDFRPHVVVLDIRMPNMSGLEAVRVFNRQPPETRPLLIAISGWPGESDKLRATMAGFDYYFGKPVGPTDIVELVKKGTSI
jgi:DNA-binding response OmpR family regulator